MIIVVLVMLEREGASSQGSILSFWNSEDLFFCLYIMLSHTYYLQLQLMFPPMLVFACIIFRFKNLRVIVLKLTIPGFPSTPHLPFKTNKQTKHPIETSFGGLSHQLRNKPQEMSRCPRQEGCLSDRCAQKDVFPDPHFPSLSPWPHCK